LAGVSGELTGAAIRSANAAAWVIPGYVSRPHRATGGAGRPRRSNSTDPLPSLRVASTALTSRTFVRPLGLVDRPRRVDVEREGRVPQEGGIGT
jgi:hypothetical protein